MGPLPTSAEALPVCLPGEGLPRGTDAPAQPSAALLPKMETDSGLKTRGLHLVAAPLRSDHQLARPEPILAVLPKIQKLQSHSSQALKQKPLT